jgi:hypothetical protein
VVDLQPQEPEPPPEPQEIEQVEVQREEREDPPDQREDTDRHNEERPINNEPLPGSEEGHRGGTSLSSTAIANLFSRMQQQIQRAFRARQPSASSSKTRRECIRSTAKANLECGVGRPPGNSAFDSAVETALNTFRLGSQRLYMPTTNEEAMDLALEDGIGITIRHSQ